MTNAELAELRGELYGLKVLLFNCLSAVAATMPEPAAYLETMKIEALSGIAAGTHGAVRPQHFQALRNAAAGIIAQALEALAKTYSRSAPPRKLQ